MADSFDPYLEWLAIPADQRPIHYYLLLGLKPLGATTEGIRKAAGDRIERVRSFTVGEHARHAAGLLAELNKARDCLTDDARRAAYDQGLKKFLAGARPQGPKQTKHCLSQSMIGALQPVRTTDEHAKEDEPAAGRRSAVVECRSHEDALAACASRNTKPLSHRFVKIWRQAVSRRLAVVGVVFVVLASGLIWNLVRESNLRSQTKRNVDAATPTRMAEASDASRPISEPRRQLVLHEIPDQIAVEGKRLEFSAGVQDPKAFQGNVRYRLGPDAPQGAIIDPRTGRFSWTPSEANGGRNYYIDLHASSGEFSATRLFAVRVRESNQNPVLAVVGDVTVEPSRNVNVQLQAQDDDDPGQRLRYHLVNGPRGATVDAQTGRFQWKAAATRAGSTLVVVVEVSDGAGGRDDGRFSIRVKQNTQSIAGTRAPNKGQVAGLDAGTLHSATDPTAVDANRRPPTGDEAESDRPQVDSRYDLPSQQAQQKAGQLLKETYEEDYRLLKTPPQKLAFARKLIDSHAALETLPAELYVMLDAAQALAVAAGDVETSLEITALWARYFKVSRHIAQSDVLKKISKSRTAGSTTAQVTLARRALETIPLAIAADDIETAAKVTGVALLAASASRDDKLAEQATSIKREILVLKRQYSALREALNSIKRSTADSQSSGLAGSWYCFVRGQWRLGLPLLASGDDPQARSLARQDLNVRDNPEDQVRIADGWWKFAERQEGIIAAQVRRRAIYWYKKARPNLQGLTSQKVEMRLNAGSASDSSLVSVMFAASSDSATSGTVSSPSGGKTAKRVSKIIPRGQSSDVLAMMSQAARSLKNAELTRDHLRFTGAGVLAELPIAVEEQTSYDLSLDCTMPSADNGIALSIPVGGRRCTAFIAGEKSKKPSALVAVDGKWEQNPTAVKGILIAGKRVNIGVRVRAERSRLGVEVFVGGKPHYRWIGSSKSLTASDAFAAPQDPRQLGIWAGQPQVTVHSIKFRLVKGDASVL